MSTVRSRSSPQSHEPVNPPGSVGPGNDYKARLLAQSYTFAVILQAQPQELHVRIHDDTP